MSTLIPIFRWNKLALQTHNFLLSTESREAYLEFAEDVYNAHQPTNEKEAQTLAEVAKLTWFVRRNEQYQAQIQADAHDTAGIIAMLKGVQILMKQWTAFSTKAKQLLVELAKTRKEEAKAEPQKTEPPVVKSSFLTESETQRLQKMIVDHLRPRTRAIDLQRLFTKGNEPQPAAPVAITLPGRPK